MKKLFDKDFRDEVVASCCFTQAELARLDAIKARRTVAKPVRLHVTNFSAPTNKKLYAEVVRTLAACGAPSAWELSEMESYLGLSSEAGLFMTASGRGGRRMRETPERRGV